MKTPALGTISREALRQAYGIVNYVPVHPGLLSSQFIRLEYAKGRLRLGLCGLVTAEATLEVTFDHPWENPLQIQRDGLGAFLAHAHTEHFSMEATAQQLILRSGTRRVVLATSADVGGYATWKKGKTTTSIANLPKALIKDLGLLAHYAPITTSADHLSAVYLVEGLGALVTDSFLVAARTHPKSKTTFPLPGVFAGLMANMGVPGGLVLAAAGSGLQFPSGYVYQSNSSALDKYPLKRMIALVKSGLAVTPVLTFKTGTLLESLKYLKAFVPGSDTDVMVACRPGPGSAITLQAQLPQTEASRRLPVADIGALPKDVFWELGPLWPWTAHVGTAKGVERVELLLPEKHVYGFRAPIKNRPGEAYLLILAERTK